MCGLKSKDPRIYIWGALFSLFPFPRKNLIMRQFYFNFLFSIRYDPNKFAPVPPLP